MALLNDKMLRRVNLSVIIKRIRETYSSLSVTEEAVMGEGAPPPLKFAIFRIFLCFYRRRGESDANLSYTQMSRVIDAREGK
jgi:hypothetical protein